MAHNITLLRHGESMGNFEKRIQGQIDYPLSDAGRQQVDTLANLWRKENMQFDLIISSPLKRTIETAQIITKLLPTPIEENPIWMERNFGTLEGALLEDAMTQYPDLDFFQPYSRIGESGESQVDLYSRALIAVQDLIHRPSGSYLVVTHGSIMNKALYVMLGITPQGNYNSPIFPFSNTAYLRIGYHSETRQWFFYEYSNPGFYREEVNNP